MEKKEIPKFIICPVCNSKVLLCEDIQCDDCINEDHKTCGFIECNCFSTDIILELHSQVTQLKIENSTLTEQLYLAKSMSGPF